MTDDPDYIVIVQRTDGLFEWSVDLNTRFRE